ncbi:MAG: 30S ribosomal protein S6 [Bryobacterales bacterium]|nr:30S ribosomal protein S6 [Bryobacterales bacterium]
MRIYEELFIVRPDATDEQIDPYIEQMRGIIESAGGTLDKADKWGKRRLAYRVEKFHEGLYILLVFQSKPEAVKEIERRMRVNDLVIKFITVRIDEKMKRIEKRRKMREKRAARKPAPVVHAPAAPTVEQQMASAGPMPGEPAPAE